MGALQRFLFDDMPVRGAWVALDGVWQDILARQAQRPGAQAWTPAMQALAGEMAAAGVLLHSSISYDGALVLQIQSEGPVQLAVAEVQPDAGLRVTLRARRDAGPGAVSPQARATGVSPAAFPDTATDFAALVGGAGASGRCAITLRPPTDQPGQQPYQGVVALTDAQGQPLPSLAQALMQYMAQSEQLPTEIVLAVNAERAVGLMVQRMPVQGAANLAGTVDAGRLEQADEDANRLAILTRSARPDELLSLDAPTLLRRLYGQEPVRLLPTVHQPHFACTCSRERVVRMIQGLGEDEARATLRTQGIIEVMCDFCGQTHRFDAAAVLGLFAAPQGTPPH